MISVYFNVIRKEEVYKELSNEQKYEQDLGFLNHMCDSAKELKKTSLYFYWFPRDVQVLIERLFQKKPLESDVGGLLGVIMIAGFDFDENDYLAYVITELYRTESTETLYEGSQNLCVLMFGTTLDDISEFP